MADIDTTLIERIVGGDADSFELLVRRYEKQVYGMALRMCRNPEDALDISQEVFLKVYRNLASFKGDSAFSTYIYRVTSNMCIDHIRKNSKRKNYVSLYAADEEGEEYDLPLADSEMNPEEKLEAAEKTGAIKKAIESLPCHHREMIVLRDLQGLSYKSISEVTGLGESTVKSRILRAREKLRGILQKDGNFFEHFESKNVETVKGGERN